MSTKSAGQAKKMGYTNVRVFLDGEPAWIKAGYPTYAAKSFIEKGNIVLIDLRSENISSAGRIPRSVTIPYDLLEDRMEDFPMKAPIVLYSDKEDEVLDGLEDLRAEGFKNVSLVPGNYEGWVTSGGKIETGAIDNKISWKRILGKGEVSAAEFMKAANGEDTNAVILDVRTNEEVSSGKFANAIAIPLDEISGRMAELPKDKKIYAHCTTGARADMAVKELNKNGFNAFFLVAEVECEGNECEVED